jgi:hypothetical protein
MIAELSGVGILGHVWTNPKDRQKGACSKLMGMQMEDFQSRQGKALFLGTGFDSVAYHIYARFGFRGVEPQSGYMAWYATSKDEFEAAYFKMGKTSVQPLGWTHWPSSPALFLGDAPCIVRCAPLRLIGRRSTESPLLPLLCDEQERQTSGEKPHTLVLQNEATTAVVGFTTWDWHPLWEHTCLVDVYCHPDYWDRADYLLSSLSLPEAEHHIAYGDVVCEQKIKVLQEAGFKQTATLKRRVPRTRSKASFLDVALFERESQMVVQE